MVMRRIFSFLFLLPCFFHGFPWLSPTLDPRRPCESAPAREPIATWAPLVKARAFAWNRDCSVALAQKSLQGQRQSPSSPLSGHKCAKACTHLPPPPYLMEKGLVYHVLNLLGFGVYGRLCCCSMLCGLAGSCPLRAGLEVFGVNSRRRVAVKQLPL